MKIRVRKGIVSAFAIMLAPAAALGQGAYDYGPFRGPPWMAPTWPMTAAPRLRVERGWDLDGYILIVHLSEIQPQEVVLTRVDEQRLRIGVQARQEVHNEDNIQDQNAWRWGYRVHIQHIAREITLPPDADLSGLSRVDGSDQVMIKIPRRP